MTTNELLEAILQELELQTQHNYNFAMLQGAIAFGIAFIAGMYTFRMLMLSKNQSRFW